MIERLLPGFTLIKSLSYVGDTWLADYDGPLRYGFHAVHLVRNKPVEAHQISSLNQVIALVDQQPYEWTRSDGELCKIVKKGRRV